MVGICTHPHWTGTVWQASDWDSAFLETGVKNTRGKIGRGPSGKGAMVRLERLFSAGVKICATVADQKSGLDRVGTKANLDFISSVVGAHNLSGLEGPNEFNNPSTKPADWATQLRSFQKWLRDTVRANPAFNNVPLVAPSIWGRLTWDYTAVGNLEPNVDRGCMHYYTGGRRPSIAGSPTLKNASGGAKYYFMADAIREAKILAPTKAMYITEFGYPIAGPNAPLSGYTITETAAAKYLLRGLLDGFAHGVQKMSIYSLIDDPNNTKYHGLMDVSLRPRKGFYAVRNLMALFADGGSLSVPDQLSYTLSGLTSTIRTQLFQKSNRQFLLTLYQDVDSYDRTARRDAEVAPVSVGLALGAAAKIEVFTPTMSASATQSVPSGSKVTIPVGDHVTVVRITPSTSTATTATTSSATTSTATTSSTGTESTSTESTSTTQERDPFEFRLPPKN